MLSLLFLLEGSSLKKEAGLPWWLSGKELPSNAGDVGSIPGSGISPGEGSGNPLWNFCLGNPVDREALWVTVQGVTKESDITVTKQQPL